MAVPVRAVLHQQMHCLTHDGLVVISAQWWRGPATLAGKPRSWLRLIRNGRVEQDCRFTGEREQVELAEFWAGRAERYAPTMLSEDEMRAKLAELAKIEPVRCQRRHCAAVLPVAWWHCPDCGSDVRRVAAGSLSGCRRRTLVLRSENPPVDL